MARHGTHTLWKSTPLSLCALLCIVSLAGCKSDADYAQAKTPPPSDPAALHGAINKLDAAYEAGYGSKFAAKVTPVEVVIGSDLYKGDTTGAVSEIGKNRKLFQDASAGAKACLFDLSKNTVIVNPTDHDAYANFYNAEGDRLNSKAAEYKAFLTLKSTASKTDVAALLDLVSDSRIKEFVAQKLRSE
jgi:hypothetical protein